jgi:phosphoenolpyruvate---glycerone phosphotransferase subunit DhaL
MITKQDFAAMVAGAAARIRQQHLRLSDLDSICGDGDHGATMLRAMDRLEEAVAPRATPDFKTCFHQAGWNVMGADGGASGSLLGAFFMGMAATPVEGATTLDCAGLAAAFEAGLAAVRKHTKAQPGDKTMMDALVPAVQSFSAAAQSGEEVGNALRSSAAAAEAGAATTKNYAARYGRARMLGERTKGSQDPGATSIALIFDGFYQGLA